MLVVVSTAGYVYFERWSWFDALYQAVSIIWTLGGEEHPLSTAGRVWTMLTVIFGFAALTYALLVAVAYAAEGGFTRGATARFRRRRVARMNDHFIICGYGRVGREIASVVGAERVGCVVIDSNPESLARAESDGHAVVQGDAANVETLRAAGIERARGLITAVDSDPDNIYIALSARVLRPDLFVVARANATEAEPKLRFAGANRVVFPYAIGGRRLATLAMRPTAVEFVDTVLSAENGELQLEDVRIPDGSEWATRSIDALVGGDEAVVLALKRDGRMRFRPPGAEMLQSGDELVIAGPPNVIRALEGRL